jgi:dihydroceramide fatty acyl 2-hydroxylase
MPMKPSPSTTAAATPAEPDSARGLVDRFGIDLAAPLLPQIAALGDDYDAWVHRGISPKTLKELRSVQAGPWRGSLRIFDRDWLESGSHIKWQHVIALWLPVALFSLGLAGSWQRLEPWPLCGWASFGFLSWTLLEYGLHRFAFHQIPRSRLGRQLHFLAHGIHHLDPWDATRLLFPVPAAVGLAVIVFGLLRLVMTLPHTLAFFGGLILGYLVYDLSHYVSHRVKNGNRWLGFLKRYHLVHHHRDHDSRFGVSQPFWDLVFRTGDLKP